MLPTYYGEEICALYHYDKIAVTNIAELFGKAYNRVTTIEKGVKITGIYPLNRHIFGEEEFTQVLEQEPDNVPTAVSNISKAVNIVSFPEVPARIQIPFLKQIVAMQLC